MTVPTDTTVTLYKGDISSPKLHPVDVADWVRLGWAERKVEALSPEEPPPAPTDKPITLYKGEEVSPPLHKIDIKAWESLGWAEGKVSEPPEKVAETPETEDPLKVSDPPKVEDPPKKRTTKSEHL